MTRGVMVADLIEAVEKLAGHRLGDDEGVILGAVDRSVTRALVCWMATREALLAAEAAAADLVIAHESVFYPYNARIEPDRPQEWERWPTNRRRLEVAQRSGMTVVRIHGTADELCIFDVFAELVGLGRPASGAGYHKIYDLEPLTLGELIERVKRAVAMDHLRVCCSESDLEKKVKRVGLPCGGMGLFVNVSYQQWALANGCDVLVAGESDSYGFRFSGECGVPMIETSHEASEIPGLRRFTEILAGMHPQVEFLFHDNGNSWRWI